MTKKNPKKGAKGRRSAVSGELASGTDGKTPKNGNEPGLVYEEATYNANSKKVLASEKTCRGGKQKRFG